MEARLDMPVRMPLLCMPLLCMRMVRMRIMPVIASMAAHTAAIGIIGFHEAHERFPPLNVLQAPFVQFGLAGVIPARHGSAVDHSGKYPAVSAEKR